jgi:hypothetical protein
MLKYTLIVIGALLLSLSFVGFHIWFLQNYLGAFPVDRGVAFILTLSMFGTIKSAAICCAFEFLISKFFGKLSIKYWFQLWLCIGALTALYYSSLWVFPLIFQPTQIPMETILDATKLFSVLSILALYALTIKNRAKSPTNSREKTEAETP